MRFICSHEAIAKAASLIASALTISNTISGLAIVTIITRGHEVLLMADNTRPASWQVGVDQRLNISVGVPATILLEGVLERNALSFQRDTQRGVCPGQVEVTVEEGLTSIRKVRE